MSCASIGPTVPYLNSTILRNYTLTGKYEFLQQIIKSFGERSPKKKQKQNHIFLGAPHEVRQSRIPSQIWDSAVLCFNSGALDFPFHLATCSEVQAGAQPLPSSSTPMQEAITSDPAPPAWPCLAARTVLPSQFCQLTCFSNCFLTHLGQKELD